MGTPHTLLNNHEQEVMENVYFFKIRVKFPTQSIPVGYATTSDCCQQMPDAIKVLFNGHALLVERSAYT